MQEEENSYYDNIITSNISEEEMNKADIIILEVKI